MAWLGYLLIAMSVVYIATAVWLVGQAKRRTAMVSHTALGVAFTGLFALAIGMVHVRAARGLEYDLFYRLAWVGWLVMPPNLSLCYELQGKARQAKWVGGVLYAVWGTLLFLSLATDLVEVGAHSVIPFVDDTGPFENPARGLAALCLVWSGWALYRASQQTRGIDRQRSRYLLLGLSLYAAGAMVGAVATQVAGVAFDPGLTVVFSIPWVALTFYSMSRYRLFDVRMVASRIASGTFLAVIATTCATVVFWLLEESLGHLGAMWLGGLSAAIILIPSPLRHVVSRVTGGRRQRTLDAADGPTTLSAVLRLDELLRRIVTVVREDVGVAHAALFLRHPTGGMMLAHASAPPASAPQQIEEGSNLLTWLHGHARILIREEQAMSLDEAEHLEIDPFGAEVVVPITHDGGLMGLLMLGPKKDRDAFLRTDIDLLENLSTQASLAIQNAQLYAALNDTKDDLDEFVRAAAHDLRSPLHGIDLLASFAEEDLSTNDDDMVAEHLGKLRGRVDRMKKLLDAVEAYVRAGRDELDQVKLDVADLIENVVRDLEIPPDFQIETHSEIAAFRTARAALAEVLRQLIDNAIAHHDTDGGRIRIAAERRGMMVTFSVSDDGPGIEAKFRDRVFEMFRTLERKDLKEGQGMGLALCRKLVNRGGGRIWVEAASPESSRGACFRFTWPLAWSKAPTGSVWSLMGQTSIPPVTSNMLEGDTARRRAYVRDGA